MKIDIWIKKTVEIPNDQLIEIAESVMEKWAKSETDQIHAEDLVIEGMALGFINTFFDDYKVDDEYFTLEELKKIAKRKR